MPVRILNLEDNPLDSELIVRELRKAALDFSLTRVGDRDEFTRALMGERPDLIISDHNVHQFDGRAALELVRAHAPDVPFILFTGSLSEESAVSYMKAGASDYILKDRIARLGPAVREALERDRERRTLRDYEGLLHQIIDLDPNLIFVRNAEGRLLLVNRAAAEALYGTTPDAVVGRSEREVAASVDEAERTLTDDREVMASGKTRLTAEYPATHRRTQERRWYQVIKVPLPDAPTPKVLVVATDITTRRQLEEQLRQAQKMEAIGQLAGGVAHDFNNLLTAIIGNADFLLQDLPADTAPRSDALEIRNAADRAAALTRQLLAFSRKQVLQPRLLDLNLLMGGMEHMLRRLLAENIDVRFHLAEEASLVHADPSQLEQVLLNLVLNARDAMPNGGKLIIESGHAELVSDEAAAVSGVAPGHYVVLAVSDTGIGMDEHVRAHLFEPFFTTKEPGQGTGLGLATVYGIVQQSGGSVWVYSEPGHGTTFKVYLPRAAAGPAETVEGQVVSAAPPRGTETVLVVEDAPAVRALASRVLAGAGYAVLTAADSAEAEAIAAAHPGTIHLLLTDVVMPGFSGRELAERIGATRPEIAVLYMSGYTDDAIVHHGVLEQGVPYLEKPFSPDQLARKVRLVLDRGAASHGA